MYVYCGWLYLLSAGQRIRASLDEPFNWRCVWATVCAEHFILTGPMAQNWEFEFRFTAPADVVDECHFCHFGRIVGEVAQTTAREEALRAA
jgi:hypothetical protein